MQRLVKLYRWLFRQYDKLEKSPGACYGGYWRIKYECGNWTRKLTYDVVSDLRDMHGGTVHHIRFEDPYLKEKENENS